MPGARRVCQSRTTDRDPGRVNAKYRSVPVGAGLIIAEVAGLCRMAAFRRAAWNRRIYCAVTNCVPAN